MNFNPIIYNEKGIPRDLSSMNLDNRIVMIAGAITPELATLVNAELLYLDSVSNEDILVYINSPGGETNAGLSIYDTMKSLNSDVVTVCQGMAASMGAILFSGGKKGKRYILPHSEVMIHQPYTGIEGKASDLRIHMSHLERTREMLIDILARNCSKTKEEIAVDINADYWMLGKEALEYGIADKVIDIKED